MHETGVVHGRFQVLHNDHMKYILAAKDRCRHLVIGITNPDPSLTRAESANPERSRPEANPLTYYERHQTVKATLLGRGLTAEDFSIVPFPINFPDLYVHYAPREAVYFVTIYDDWGRAKMARFKEMGLAVEILWDRPLQEKGITAGQVRKLMIEDGFWEELVPPPVAVLMKAWAIPERLRAGGLSRPES